MSVISQIIPSAGSPFDPSVLPASKPSPKPESYPLPQDGYTPYRRLQEQSKAFPPAENAKESMPTKTCNKRRRPVQRMSASSRGPRINIFRETIQEPHFKVDRDTILDKTSAVKTLTKLKGAGDDNHRVFGRKVRRPQSACMDAPSNFDMHRT